MKVLKLLSVLFILSFAGCSTPMKSVSSYQSGLYTIDSALDKDTAMQKMLTAYREQEQKAMEQIVGYTKIPLSKAQPECTLGNLVADAQLIAAQRLDSTVRVSVCNYGGIRIPYISPGVITRGIIYQIMPFDNKLLVVEIPGKIMRQFCDHIAAWGGWPVSGITFQIKDKKAAHILIDGKPVQDQLIYKTVISDYIANGGDNCHFLRDCKRRVYNIFIRDTIMEYIEDLNQHNRQVNISLQNRITYAD